MRASCDTLYLELENFVDGIGIEKKTANLFNSFVSVSGSSWCFGVVA